MCVHFCQGLWSGEYSLMAGRVTFLAFLTPQAHSSVERAGLIGSVRMKKLPTDSKFAVRGEALRNIIDEDKAAGLIPFYVSIYNYYTYV